jgi:uncharacterized protein (DUF169 family)
MMPYGSFEYGKDIGIVIAPLITAAFEPDLVIIYSSTDHYYLSIDKTTLMSLL